MTCDTQPHKKREKNGFFAAARLRLLCQCVVCFDRYLYLWFGASLEMHAMHKTISLETAIIFFFHISSSSSFYLLLFPSLCFDFVLAICDVPNFTLFRMCMLCWCTFFVTSFTQNLTSLNETMRSDSIECDLFGSFLELVFSSLLFIFYYYYYFFFFNS